MIIKFIFNNTYLEEVISFIKKIYNNDRYRIEPSFEFSTLYVKVNFQIECDQLELYFKRIYEQYDKGV